MPAAAPVIALTKKVDAKVSAEQRALDAAA
jgi:hypothetical protein